MKKWILIISLFFIVKSYAQNTRISDHNTIGWYAYNGTFNLNKKWSIAAEYQWRRNNIITDWQQSLLRTGITYKVNNKLSVRAGYAWIETFNYGDHPLNGMGKQFTEHRIYQAAFVNDKIGIAEINQRFMLEQRWIGRYTNAALNKEDDFVYVNRLRYNHRIQVPLKGSAIGDKVPYAAIFDEILLGFGKNVNENVFDQNRVGILLGYRFSPVMRVEGGYINQIVQLGREVGGRNVFQYNNGIMVSFITNMDL